jgi:hypothetical protein
VLEIRAGGEVTLMDHRFQKGSLHVDNVVLASVVPEDGLYDQLRQSEMLAVKIGDAARVRNLRAAVQEGANVGLTIDDDVRLNANGAAIASLPSEIRDRQ